MILRKLDVVEKSTIFNAAWEAWLEGPLHKHQQSPASKAMFFRSITFLKVIFNVVNNT